MFDNKPRISYFGQFGILIGLFGAGLILAVIIQLFFALSMVNLGDLMSGNDKALLHAMTLPENINKVRWMQMLGTFAMMFLPAFFFALIVSKKPLDFFGLNKPTNTQLILLVIAIAVTALFLSGGLGELNKLIPIPKKWELKFKRMEDNYADQVMMLANMKSIADYFISLVMIAILPALFEELLFRGTLQQLFIRWFKNAHVAIFVTSFLFSIIHFSYFGFLPRLALGLMLGYIFYFSKNIWLSMLMHFINNGIAITALYFATRKGEDVKKVMDESYPIWVAGVTLIIVLYLFKLYKATCEKFTVQHSNDQVNLH